VFFLQKIAKYFAKAGFEGLPGKGEQAKLL
jgi:hypothetical protein